MPWISVTGQVTSDPSDPNYMHSAEYYQAIAPAYQAAAMESRAALLDDLARGVTPIDAISDAQARSNPDLTIPASVTTAKNAYAAAHEGQETRAQTAIREATGVDVRDGSTKDNIDPHVPTTVAQPFMPVETALPTDAKPNLWIPAAAVAAWWFLL